MKIFLALLLLIPTLSLYVKLETKFCFLVDATDKGKYRFQFEAVSNTTDNVTISIVTRNGVTLLNQNTHRKQMELPSDTDFTVCYINDDSELTYVTMDLWSENANHIKQLATKSDIKQLHYEMRYLSEGLQNISKQQKFQEQRQELHSTIILGFQNKIKWLGTVKILLIITLAVAQILILRCTLNDDSKLSI